MRKIVVCEDGEREAEKIQKMLQDDQGIFEEEVEIFLYTTGKKLIDDCKSGKLTPDLVFMDIELPDMTGIEVAKEINYLVPYCYIVYVTNHVDYFTDVYSTEHQYYVLKKELKEHFPQIKEKIWRMEQEHNDTIIIPIKNKQQRMLHKESIRYMERKGRKTYIHVVDDDIVETSLRLDELETLLGSYFVRCHNSFIVHFRYVQELQRDGYLLYNKDFVQISRGYNSKTKEDFLKWSILYM